MSRQAHHRFHVLGLLAFAVLAMPALAGDRSGLKVTRHMQSWNSAHGSRGCSQDQLKSSGGAGLIYCFAAD